MKSLDKEYETLALDEATPGVVVVTLNRPDRYNAMTNTMFDELEQLALALDHEHGCRVVVLTGAGQAFCSGYDLADADELPGLGALGMLDQQERAARALHAVRGMRVPVIAAVNGAAAGGGVSLALAEAIVANSPGGVQLSKRALQANLEISSYAAALELENRGQALLTRSADMAEALAAFKEKRPAVFTG